MTRAAEVHDIEGVLAALRRVVDDAGADRRPDRAVRRGLPTGDGARSRSSSAGGFFDDDDAAEPVRRRLRRPLPVRARRLARRARPRPELAARLPGDRGRRSGARAARAARRQRPHQPRPGGGGRADESGGGDRRAEGRLRPGQRGPRSTSCAGSRARWTSCRRCSAALDVVLGRFDEEILGFQVERARRESWDAAVLLAGQPPDARDSDRSACSTATPPVSARTVLAPPFPIPAALAGDPVRRADPDGRGGRAARPRARALTDGVTGR